MTLLLSLHTSPRSAEATAKGRVGEGGARKQQLHAFLIPPQHACVHTHVHVHAQAHLHSHTRTHTRAKMRCSHVLTITRAAAHAKTRAHTHVCPPARKRTHMHSGARRPVRRQHTHARAVHTLRRNTRTHTQKLRKLHKVCSCFSLPKNEETADGPWEMKMVTALQLSQRLVEGSSTLCPAQSWGTDPACSAAPASRGRSKSECQLQVVPVLLPDWGSCVILLWADAYILLSTLP